MKITALVLGASAAFAVAEPHKHAHRHSRRHGSPVERRAADVTSTVQGPTVTLYELDGQSIPADEVAKGLKEGWYVLVAEPTTSSKTSSTSAVSAAEFYQKQVTTSSTPVPTPTSTYVAPTTSSTPPPAAPTTQAAAKSSTASSSSSSGGAGLDSDFPSGTLSCSEFPSSYGAVRADWLGLDGWTGIQNTPNFGGLADNVISYIATAISGGCTTNSFCSYSCPPGYQKSQWPKAQGATGQSIGGLYCNSNGKLELSNANQPKLCIAGTGGVSVKSSLSSVVSICRTDYPGTESETIATEVQPGGSQPLTCPDAKSYYSWQGAATSAQYYINPSGNDASKACKWGTAGSNLGNFSPVNLGVGKGLDGNTWISMFQNAPTNTDGCLDFSMKITGDTSATCSYKNCKFYTNDVETGTGCTTMVSGQAVYELY